MDVGGFDLNLLSMDVGSLQTVRPWGPPGVGRTTAVRTFAHPIGFHFVAFVTPLMDATNHLSGRRPRVRIAASASRPEQ